MELPSISDGFLGGVERLYNELKASHKDELQRQRGDAQTVQRQLKAEIAALQGRLSTHDELLQENIRLRQTLLEQQSAVSIPQSDKVHIDQYRALQSKCESYAQKLQKANFSGEQYKSRCHELQKQRRRDKEVIKTWQDYHASLERRRSAHNNVSSLFAAIGDPPQLHQHDEENAITSSHARPTSSSSRAEELPHQVKPLEVLEPVEEEVLDLEQDPQEHVGDPRSSPPLHNKRQSASKTVEEGGKQLAFDNDQEYMEGLEAPMKRTIIRSSQSTDVDADQIEISPSKPAAVQVEEDDEPEILSVRATKRKRKASPPSRATAPPKTMYIKDEGGSSPMHHSALGRMNQQESIDLDNVTPAFMTPRKRRKLSQLRRSMQLSPRRERELDSLRHERSNSMPASLERLRELGMDCSTTDDVQVRETNHFDTGHTRRQIEEGFQRQQHQMPDNNPPEREQQRDAEPQPAQSTHVLQHLDVNKPVLPRISEPRSSAKRRRGRGPIHEFTEDGEQYSRRRSGKKGITGEVQQANPAEALQSRRLTTLLDEQSIPPRSALTPSRQMRPENQEPADADTRQFHDQDETDRSLVAKQKARETEDHGDAPLRSFSAVGRQRLGKLDQLGVSMTPSKMPAPAPRSKSLPWDEAQQQPSTSERAAVLLGRTTIPTADFRTSKPATTTTGKLKTPTTAFKSRQKPTTSAIPAATPDPSTITNNNRPSSKGKLRTLSPSRLRPSDFRINPAANHGYDFAYSDTIRKQSEKRCAPGCTNPSCCGDKFSKMLAIGGPIKTRGRSLWDPSSSQEDPDEALLRDYMGDNYAVVASMTKAQREEAVMKARTVELAGRVGKHRHQWQRSRTPPGFWRTDFPTTQENVRDRQEVARREREEVEERRREAMRGGRWKFADE